MEKQKHREPTLYIVGGKERADEIRRILEDEWGGDNKGRCTYTRNDLAYYIDMFGVVDSLLYNSKTLVESVANGWMQEYKLPEKPQFKPFDKVVVKLENDKWCADFYSHEDGEYIYLIGNVFFNKKAVILPYNEQTAKLIGTTDKWKGGYK